MCTISMYKNQYAHGENVYITIVRVLKMIYARETAGRERCLMIWKNWLVHNRYELVFGNIRFYTTAPLKNNFVRRFKKRVQ